MFRSISSTPSRLLRHQHPAWAAPSALTSVALSARNLNANASGASRSRHSFSTTTTATAAASSGRSHISYTWKGKGRSYTPLTLDKRATLAPPLTFRTPLPGVSPLDSSIRGFHATHRRDALPILPAVGALLKTTSLLTIATGFSRILISFFPIGTLATLRLAKGVTWLSKDKRIPKASPDAEEFFKMWCDDEKGVRVTHQEAADLVHAPEAPNDGLLAPDGRIAYSIPLPKHWRRRSDTGTKPAEDDATEYARWVRATHRRIKQTFFFLPELPPASVRYYNELSVTEREEVDALRRYWISLRMFKDRLKYARWLVATLIGVPILMLLGVWATGLERVPFTGRWRLILLTADEEDAISDSLEGANWFRSVINLLTTPEKPAPPIVPLSDWRWQWVQGTLRHIESGVISVVERIDSGVDEKPPGTDGLWPPPARYPLRPRPRASARLHAALPGGERESGSEHLEVGPPYNVMILDAPDKNAFSYGFGGKGAGGIVIFTGLLDEILSKGGAPPPPPPPPPPRGIFGGLFSSTPRPAPTRQWPTEEQTLHLATVIAHEMGHLLLSHHLETLSHQQVLWPSVVGLSVDMLRAFIWPFTIFLGPGVNDALAALGRTSTEELTRRYGHIGFDTMHEYEADSAALRLLAHAGYDARKAVDQFAGSLTRLEEIQEPAKDVPWWSLFKLWSRGAHPTSQERVDAMKEELVRWEKYDAERELKAKQKGGERDARKEA